MTPADALLRLAGQTLAHVTAAENMPSIRANGLKPAETLAQEAGIDPGQLVLRQTRLCCGAARLNHQLPFYTGRALAAEALQGHSMESWSRQLDRRVYFWPANLENAFGASISKDCATEVLYLDSRRFAEKLSDRIFLSPINSGNFTRRPAKRGDWIYVPLTDGSEAFCTNRQTRGLVKSRDRLREVSVIGSIAADILADLLV